MINILILQISPNCYLWKMVDLIWLLQKFVYIPLPSSFVLIQNLIEEIWCQTESLNSTLKWLNWILPDLSVRLYSFFGNTKQLFPYSEIAY